MESTVSNENDAVTGFIGDGAKIVKCADLVSVKALLSEIFDICLDATSVNTPGAYEGAVSEIIDICDRETHDIVQLLRT